MKWLLITLLTLLAALVLESGLLAYAMYVLLGLLLLSRFLARNWLGGLSASRACDRNTMEVGESASVTLTVKNRGWLPVPWVLLEDLVPRRALSATFPRLKVKGSRLQLRMLPARGSVDITYRLKALLRGYYQIGPLVMESGDLFGLHRRNRVATEPDFLTVYPKVVPLEGYDLASRRPVGEVRLTHRLYEDPTRITGVREYQTGDPFNRVHWRATARTGLLHCKVYEPSSLTGASILLDFHQDGYPTRGEPHRSELAVTAAVSLAHAVTQAGQQVGLATNGRDAADRIRAERAAGEYHSRKAARQEAGMKEDSDRLRPIVVDTRRGIEQFERIRETLARVELSDGLAFGNFVSEVSGRLARNATVLALLPAVPSESALALGNLRRRGFTVSAILVMVDEGEFPQAAARLVAEGILDVRHLENESQLPTLCQSQVVRGTPYRIAATF